MKIAICYKFFQIFSNFLKNFFNIAKKAVLRVFFSQFDFFLNVFTYIDDENCDLLQVFSIFLKNFFKTEKKTARRSKMTAARSKTRTKCEILRFFLQNYHGSRSKHQHTRHARADNQRNIRAARRLRGGIGYRLRYGRFGRI